jgi:hypothetical protein
MPTKTFLVLCSVVIALALTSDPPYIRALLPQWFCCTSRALIGHHEWPDEDTEHGSIKVYLKHADSRADHSEAVGQDVQPFVQNVVHDYEGAIGLVYYGY